MRLIFFLLLLAGLASSSKILAILDSKALQTSHSVFFSLLEKHHDLSFAFSFQKTPIELKYFDRFIYDHIIVMSTSAKEIQSKLKVKDILSYFDEGGNVIVIGDIDTSFSYRKLYHAFGIELEESGTRLKDHFNNHQTSKTITTLNYEPIAPFFTPNQAKKPLLYEGVGLNLVNYDNYQLYNLIRAEPTTFSKNQHTNTAVKAGTTITLAAAVQGLNNARAVLSGSLFFFSNEALNSKEHGNQQVVEDLLSWTFHHKGIVRVKSMSYHGLGTENKEIVFNVGEKIFFSAEIQEWDSKNDLWTPYVTEDLQVELVMLDPWVRTSLVKGPHSTYLAQFHAPQKEGIYQFKILYKKPGFNFITTAQRVTIRPYKHDQFQRFLFVAYPYFLGTFSTILATFIFITLYLYTGDTTKAKED